MNNKTQAFSAVLFTIVLAGGATSACGQPAAPASQLQPGQQPPLCDVILAIKTADTAQNGHLKVGQWLRFMGPIPPQGHMIVIPVERPSPVPPHAWRPGLFVASRFDTSQNPPWVFVLSGVPVLSPPDHAQIRSHRYRMTVKTVERGCPRNIDFDTMPHEDEITDDHPGHANAD